jgi:hypothetical protein
LGDQVDEGVPIIVSGAERSRCRRLEGIAGARHGA